MDNVQLGQIGEGLLNQIHGDNEAVINQVPIDEEALVNEALINQVEVSEGQGQMDQVPPNQPSIKKIPIIQQPAQQSSFSFCKSYKQDELGFHCPICMNEYDKTVNYPLSICPNLHDACNECYYTYKFDYNQDICPLCKEPLNEKPIPDYKLFNAMSWYSEYLNNNYKYKKLQKKYKKRKEQIKQLKQDKQQLKDFKIVQKRLKPSFQMRQVLLYTTTALMLVGVNMLEQALSAWFKIVCCMFSYLLEIGIFSQVYIFITSILVQLLQFSQQYIISEIFYNQYIISILNLFCTLITLLFSRCLLLIECIAVFVFLSVYLYQFIFIVCSICRRAFVLQTAMQIERQQISQWVNDLLEGDCFTLGSTNRLVLEFVYNLNHIFDVCYKADCQYDSKDEFQNATRVRLPRAVYSMVVMHVLMFVLVFLPMVACSYYVQQ